MIRLRDRSEAGRLLARECARFVDQGPIVLALPRGGVPVAWEIAAALDAPLGLLMVRKIGAPGHPEFGIGAVVDGAEHQVILNDDVVSALSVDPGYIKRTVARELAEIKRRRVIYLGGGPSISMRGRTVIVVDDGVATGGTLRAALSAIRESGAARVVVAVPLAPAEICAAIADEVNDAIILLRPEPFTAVGAYYETFEQVEDNQVVAVMQRARERTGTAK